MPCRRALAALFAVALLAVVGCTTHKPGVLNPPVPPAKPPEAPGPGQPIEPGQEKTENELEPDRPDVTNGTHLVPVALAQLELGGQYSHVSDGEEFGTPVALRIGVTEWLEARIESDTLSIQALPGQPAGVSAQAAQTNAGFGNLDLGAKLRLWAAPGWPPVFDLMPTVTLPVGDQPSTGVSLLFLTGSDFLEHYHVDVNYGLAALPTDSGAHVLQQQLSGSVSREVGRSANPYAELFWFSKDQNAGGPVLASDFGLVYSLGERYAVDGGFEIGFTRSAPKPGVFGGLTVIVGEVRGHHGVHERLREAAVRRIATGR